MSSMLIDKNIVLLLSTIRVILMLIVKCKDLRLSLHPSTCSDEYIERECKAHEIHDILREYTVYMRSPKIIHMHIPLSLSAIGYVVSPPVPISQEFQLLEEQLWSHSCLSYPC